MYGYSGFLPITYVHVFLGLLHTADSVFFVFTLVCWDSHARLLFFLLFCVFWFLTTTCGYHPEKENTIAGSSPCGFYLPQHFAGSFSHACLHHCGILVPSLGLFFFFPSSNCPMPITDLPPCTPSIMPVVLLPWFTYTFYLVLFLVPPGLVVLPPCDYPLFLLLLLNWDWPALSTYLVFVPFPPQPCLWFLPYL